MQDRSFVQWSLLEMPSVVGGSTLRMEKGKVRIAVERSRWLLLLQYGIEGLGLSFRVAFVIICISFCWMVFVLPWTERYRLGESDEMHLLRFSLIRV